MLISNAPMAGEWYAVKSKKINIIEKTIENKLWEYINSTSQVKFNPRKTYNYQYTNEGTNIYINAFCETWGRKNLNKELLIVRDGGSCYFQIHYNYKTEMFSKLNVNGEA